ncbi:ARM repeat-containing protein [Violaceomyces palustris]|uniref:ARM repeat-containing protein n=1 Tax=Violaceomyces palustris TaxID=1673888 RepID=A0ACD0NWC9_9BASI|nr:ARM repeat-containing protein [Violaceomyces palustris]
MRTKDVRNWISTSDGQAHSTPYDSDDEMAPRDPKVNDDQIAKSPLDDWPSFLERVDSVLLSSSTKARVQLLGNELLEIAKNRELESAQRIELLSILLRTCPIYIDRESRTSALAVGAELIKADEGAATKESKIGSGMVIKYAVGWLKKEADRICKVGAHGAPASAFSYRSSVHTWLCKVFSVLCSIATENTPAKDSPCWAPLLATLATTFDSLMSDGDRKPANKKNVLSVTRRTLRETQSAIPSILDTLTSTAAGPAALRAVPLLGEVVNVAIRLRVGSEKTKGSEEGVGRGYVKAAKPNILPFYSTHMIASKTPVPDHILSSLDDFIGTCITDEDLSNTIRPQLEKMLLRSPEVSLPIGSSLFSAFQGDTSQHLKSLLNSIMSSSRSSAASTREKAVEFFTILVTKAKDAAIVKAIVSDMLAMLKAGKATSPEARAASYAMLGNVREVEVESSAAIADTISSMLAKESQEISMQAGVRTVCIHLKPCLLSGKAPSAAVATALNKELQNPKIPVRKAACVEVGSFLWSFSTGEEQNAETKAFCESILPGLEANLKASSTNMLTSPSGPLEGYVATAVLVGRMATWGSSKIDDTVKKNAVLQGVASVAPKASFLLSDKIFRKISTRDEEFWLVRALESVFTRRVSDFKSDEQAGLNAMLAFLHVALNGTSSESKRAAISSLQKVVHKEPSLASGLAQRALDAWLQQRETGANIPAKVSETEDGVVAKKSSSREMKLFLQAASSFPDEMAVFDRYEALVGFLVVAHSPELEDKDRQCFMDLCHFAKVKPGDLLSARLSDLLGRVQAAIAEPRTQKAAFSAITTLTMIAPEDVIAELVASIEQDIQCDEIEWLSQDDIGMWKTEAGNLYVDVLSIQKETPINKNSKDANIEQWEAELRASIAKKKAAANKTLTKEQKAAVDAQMKVEAEVRTKVNQLQTRLSRSLRTICSMVQAHSEELDGYMLSLVKLVIDVLAVPQATLLAGAEAKRAFWALASCCSSRLENYAMFAGVAILRCISEELVEEDFTREPLVELVLRVLYRLRSLSEQSPLDAATVAFLDPLITKIIQAGGLGIAADDGDATLEQIQLALDYISFHGNACEDVRFPRASFIDNLVIIVARHTQLAKDAVAALRDLGEAIKTSTLPNELYKLLSNTMADEVYVRSGCLQALQPLDLTDLDFSAELWLACHDEDEENARLAEKAWEENGLDVPAEFPSLLIPLLEHKNAYVRSSCARALAEATRVHPEKVEEVIEKLCDLYKERSKPLAPEYDKFGMVIESTLNREDPWHIRSAIAVALRHLAELFNSTDVVPFFEFLIVGQALGDRNEDVRQKMLEAATTVIDVHGGDRLSELINMFENYFSHPTPASDSNDGVTEAVVILFGREARHLSATDGRVTKVVERLIDALKTPSELVQSAVADCLPPLAGAISKDVPGIFEKLFSQLFHGAKYAERRGAAYGLAGLIMGRGIGSIKEFRVMQRLAQAIDDTKDHKSRQGTMFAYETLTVTLRRLFEPYVIDILPHLLTCFGDGSADVREATSDAARAIMQNVSGHCIKLILPTLLEGLEEKQWRTKKGAIELLGAMAYCAPKQLSMSLPTVIPRLSEVLTDSHTQVRTAANKSLKQFGEVISNPEIKGLVPILLKALIDPNTKTPAALKGLLETSFVHYIDSPSLALLVPIIDRGLRERSASTQKDAARIVGNLAGLTDSKDFVPYLNKLIPMVRLVLISPVPEARATAAKALGTLVERLGEVHFVDLVPSLLQVLRSDATGVDRQGAAQGLAEVLAGLGMERMENLLPEIINSATSARAYVREGHISLLIYLPATFGHRFTPHLGRIIPPILGGIADEVESVREASMRAGRMIIANYSSKAVDLLLPQLEDGLFDESWRIRMSSLQLVADLLFRLSGISGKNEVEEEEEGDGAEENVVANNSVQKALVEALGQERRDRILASIYIVRQDPNIPVRQAAIHTWKALVQNTPRTAREVLPTMLDILIKALASKGEENREMAARTLGELVKKLGEKILRETIPILRSRGAMSDHPKTRSGVCFAITEILANSTKTQLEDHEDAIIAVVRHALVDESQAVRHAAAQAFDATQQYIGPRAIDETIPTLLGALSDTSGGSSQTALAALREVMRARADVVFPVLVPTLIAQPITSFNAKALAVLVKVAGTALNRRLSSILTALSKSLQVEKDDEIRSDLQVAVEAILGSVTDVDGLHQTMILLLGWAGSNHSPDQRVAGCKFFTNFCQVKKPSVELSDYITDWIRKLITLFDDPVPQVVDAAWLAIDACLKTVSKEDMEGLVVATRRTLENTGMPGRDLPGLCRPKGAGPLIPVFLAGLMNGTAEQREQGAMGLADIVERTSADAIKPFVTSMIGPLIRLCGDRHPPAVKAAILTSLDTMLRRIPQHVRPFYPQLQRSYQKAVSDSSNIVRTRAGVALGTLMALQTRVDPVILELVQGAKAGTGEGAASATLANASVDPVEVADSFATALAKVLTSAPTKNIGDASRQAVVALIEAAFDDSSKESFKVAVAEVCGALASHDAEVVRSVVETLVLSPASPDSQLASLCVKSMVDRAPKALYDLGLSVKASKQVAAWLGEPPAVARPAREAKELMKSREPWSNDPKVLEWL